METPTSIHEEIGEQLQGFGGFLRCETCGHRQELGSTAAHLATGWPRHCGYTMRWWTQSQVDAGEVPAIGASTG